MDYRFIIITLVGVTLIGACSSGIHSSKKKEQVRNLIKEVKSTYAPDSRVAVFNIKINTKERPLKIEGETNLPEAKAALNQKFSEAGINYSQDIKVLPEQSLNGKIAGVINISVANMRSEPSHPAQLVTQATMGTPVKVLKKDGNWYYIQTPDDYLGWVDAGAFTLMDEPAFNRWQKSPKIIFLNTYGYVYKSPEAKEVISDVVATNILSNTGDNADYYEVNLPDGRKGYVEKSNALPFDNWINQLNPTGESLVNTARKFMGFPYLWGGTSPKGMDCSGFTKTVYFLNGIILPRDASQQVKTGKLVDENQNFKNLAAGDLLFFGREATDSTSESISHVGIWTGENQEFIHAAASGTFQGKVVVSSFNKNASNYDEHNLDRYVRSKRILDNPEGNIIELSKLDLY